MHLYASAHSHTHRDTRVHRSVHVHTHTHTHTPVLTVRFPCRPHIWRRPPPVRWDYEGWRTRRRPESHHLPHSEHRIVIHVFTYSRAMCIIQCDIILNSDLPTNYEQLKQRVCCMFLFGFGLLWCHLKQCLSMYHHTIGMCIGLYYIYISIMFYIDCICPGIGCTVENISRTIDI
jgi:hypothetical protein